MCPIDLQRFIWTHSLFEHIKSKEDTSLNGKLLDAPQKGINIIKYDDMTTRKAVIKWMK